MVPYGRTLVDGKLEIVPEEAATLRHIRDLLKEKRSWRGVVGALDREGKRTRGWEPVEVNGRVVRKGKPAAEWTSVTVKRVLLQPSMAQMLGTCTTYELSKAMQGSFDFFWPRARSRIYAEVKRLASLGLLEARKDYVGKRPRTIYSSTQAGRAALASWLDTPPKAFALEFEGLLRVYLAPFGTRDDLLQALETVADQAGTMLQVGAAFRRGYLEGTSRFMDQVHVRALVNDFLVSYADLVRRWSVRSIATVRSWDNLTPDGKTEAALQTIALTHCRRTFPVRADNQPQRMASPL
jgi:DNA-binding PadR family transcriptional regulator